MHCILLISDRIIVIFTFGKFAHDTLPLNGYVTHPITADNFLACIAEQEKKNFYNNSEEKIREKELGGVV